MKIVFQRAGASNCCPQFCLRRQSLPCSATTCSASHFANCNMHSSAVNLNAMSGQQPILGHYRSVHSSFIVHYFVPLSWIRFVLHGQPRGTDPYELLMIWQQLTCCIINTTQYQTLRQFKDHSGAYFKITSLMLRLTYACQISCSCEMARPGNSHLQASATSSTGSTKD